MGHVVPLGTKAIGKVERLRFRQHLRKIEWKHTKLKNIDSEDVIDSSFNGEQVSTDQSQSIVATLHCYPEVEWIQYTWFFSVLPLISLCFPFLLESASSSNIPEEKRFFLILLLIVKRIYLYFLALSTVDVAARRSFNCPPELGQRLKLLNDEIFGNFSSGLSSNEQETFRFLD